MNKDNLRKATQALRSDKYQQITGYAHTDEGFCAFGVMADVTGLGEWRKAADGDYYIYATNHLPIGALDEWYGVDSGFAYIHDEEGDLVSIMALNDDRGYDFHQIAALIEKEFDL